MKQLHKGIKQNIFRRYSVRDAVNKPLLLGFGYVCSFLIIIYITGYALKLLQTQRLFTEIYQEGMDYEAFRDLHINASVIEEADRIVVKIQKKYEGLKNHPYINRIGYITLAMLLSDYQPEKFQSLDDITFLRGIGKLCGTELFQELYGYYNAILTDLKYFPVPMVGDGKEDISYVDTWYALREYGGKRRHEGTDLMASNNKRGYFPVISMTDGIIENIGWLEKGGNRIGIRAKSGGYFYYAHLDSYAPGLKEGDEVIAGQLLGFMGDSGYGSEGTIGKFAVHLHVGIYVDTDMGEMSINPYWILRMLEKNRTIYQDN